MEVILLQLQKAYAPILVTLLGMAIDVRRQSEKAQPPMLVTLLGILVFLHPAINVLDDVSIIA